MGIGRKLLKWTGPLWLEEFVDGGFNVFNVLLHNNISPEVLRNGFWNVKENFLSVRNFGQT